nr:hypothetical protein [Tanacetum cinerariifolium]
ESTSGRAKTAAEFAAESLAEFTAMSTAVSTAGRRRQQILPGPTAVTVEEITNTKGPVPIQFELRDKQTVMPLGDNAAQWSSYIGEVIRGVPLYYPSWLKVPKER